MALERCTTDVVDLISGEDTGVRSFVYRRNLADLKIAGIIRKV